MISSEVAFIALSTAMGIILGLTGWIASFDERDPGAAFLGTLFLLYAAWGVYLLNNV